MTLAERILVGAIIVAAFGGLVMFAILVAATDDDDAQIEEATYDRARAADRALRTPVVLPPCHPSRPDRAPLEEVIADLNADRCPDEVDEWGAA